MDYSLLKPQEYKLMSTTSAADNPGGMFLRTPSRPGSESGDSSDDDNGLHPAGSSNVSIEGVTNSCCGRYRRLVGDVSTKRSLKQASVMQLMPMASAATEKDSERESENERTMSAFKPYAQSTSSDRFLGSSISGTPKRHSPCSTEDSFGSGLKDVIRSPKKTRLMRYEGDGKNKKGGPVEDESRAHTAMKLVQQTSSGQEVDRGVNEKKLPSPTKSFLKDSPTVNLQFSIFDRSGSTGDGTVMKGLTPLDIPGQRWEGTMCQSSFTLTSEDSSSATDLDEVAHTSSCNNSIDERFQHKFVDTICSIQRVMGDADPERQERWGQCWRDYCQRIELHRKQAGYGRVYYGSRAFF